MPLNHNLMLQNDNPTGKNGAIDSDAILAHLTNRQHLNPHAKTADVLAQTVDLFGCCPVAIERGMEWLQIDSDRPIGRLRRSELVQLSRAVHRFWMQNAAAVPTVS